MRLSRTAIDRVAEQRMADRRHVDPDLVGPAGFQPAFDQRRVAAAARAASSGLPRACRGRPSTIAIFLRLADERASGASTVPSAVLRHARRRSPDSAGRSLWAANCLASPSCATSVLATTSSPDVSLSMRWTMPGPRDPADARQAAAAMVEQGVDQRPVAIARGRDGRPARRACRRPADARPRRRSASGMSCGSLCAGVGLGDGEGETLVALDLDRRVADRACRRGSARRLGQRLQPLARQGRDRCGERAVEPPAGMAGVQRDFDRLDAPRPLIVNMGSAAAAFNGAQRLRQVKLSRINRA